jgi:predicted metal-dependent peptidase
MLLVNTELTPQQRLDRTVTDIMAHKRYIALAGVMMIGTRKTCPNTPTAYTNGRDEVYGETMINALTEENLRYIVLHEVEGHKLHRHLTTWAHLFELDAECANKAADYYTNLMLNDENKEDRFAVMPTGEYAGLVDEKYRGMDTAQIFNDLYEKKQEEEKKGGESGDEPKGFDEHDWKDAKEMSEPEKRALDAEIERAVRQGAITAGKMGGVGGLLSIGKLLKPKIDPKALLHDFVTQTCVGKDDSTWRRFNRRKLAMGLLAPSGISEKVGELVFAIDTSGSCMSEREMTKFLSIAKQIAETTSPTTIRIIYWGTSIGGDELYGLGGKPIETMIESMKPRSTGGTRISCLTEYMKEKKIEAQAVVVLTDGYLGGDWGKWDKPVLWLITSDNTPSTRPDVGKYAHVKFN